RRRSLPSARTASVSARDLFPHSRPAFLRATSLLQVRRRSAPAGSGDLLFLPVRLLVPCARAAAAGSSEPVHQAAPDEGATYGYGYVEHRHAAGCAPLEGAVVRVAVEDDVCAHRVDGLDEA